MSHNSNTIWDRRYQAGALWGEFSSATAKLLLSKLETESRVLDVGCGYGRDVITIGGEGHYVTGIDRSLTAINMARKRVLAAGLNMNKVELAKSDSASLSSDEGVFDALLSHRFLHLLDEASAHSFSNAAAKLVRPGGCLAISARNQNDFCPNQMRFVSDGVAEYRDRPGHRVRFFDQARYRQLFEPQFRRLQFVDMQEQESITNQGVLTHITIILCQRSLA